MAASLIDAVIARHAAARDLHEDARSQGCRISDLLDDLLSAMGSETATLTQARHIQPDFHGNRSPQAEAWWRGGIDGLTLHADATGGQVLVPDQPEPVLLGGAMMGAVAAGSQPDLRAAMAAMSGEGTTVAPRGGSIAAYHDCKYRVFRRMQADHAAYRAIMSGTEGN